MAAPQRTADFLVDFYDEHHSREARRSFQLGSQSSPMDNNESYGVVVDIAEPEYEIDDPQPGFHAVITGSIYYRAHPRMSPSTKELNWLSIKLRATFGSSINAKYITFLENTVMNEAAFRQFKEAFNGGEPLPLPLQQQLEGVASSPFKNFLSSSSHLDLQMKPTINASPSLANGNTTSLCTFVLILPAGDPFFFPTDQVGYFSRNIKIECKGSVTVRPRDDLTLSVSQPVSRTVEIGLIVKRTKVMKNGVWIQSEAPI